MELRINSAAIRNRAERILADYQVPGMALAIVKDDSLLFAAGYGQQSIDATALVDIHTRFGIASISKSFTAMALGMLVDEGLLAWSDPVTKYIPSFQLFDAHATREFTVRDLLTHRSGLPEIAGGTLWYGSSLSREQVIAGVRHLKPITSFRSQYAYQNITYLVAGQIIPALTGRSWEDFIQERIFKPLGMSSSNTSIHAHGRNNNIAQPHVLIDGKQTRVALRDYDNVGPAASINTTVIDLSAYALLLLNGGRYGDQQLYGPQIAADLWTPHTLIPITAQSPGSLKLFLPRFHNTYALGWVIQDVPGRSEIKISHSGGIDGLRSLLTLVPDDKLGIIVFTNNEGPAPAIMTQCILDLHWDRQDKNWYSNVLSDFKKLLEQRADDAQKDRNEGTSPSLSPEQYAGKYHSQLIGDIAVDINKGVLSLHFPHTPSFSARLSHWHYDTFRLSWQDPVVPPGFITFILDAAGIVSEIRFDQPNLLDVDFSEIHPVFRRH